MSYRAYKMRQSEQYLQALSLAFDSDFSLSKSQMGQLSKTRKSGDGSSADAEQPAELD